MELGYRRNRYAKQPVPVLCARPMNYTTTTPPPMGGRIRSRREQLGLKQADIARAVHVSTRTAGAWERNEVTISSQHLTVLAEYLQTTPDFLQGLEPNAETALEGRYLEIHDRAVHQAFLGLSRQITGLREAGQERLAAVLAVLEDVQQAMQEMSAELERLRGLVEASPLARDTRESDRR